MWEGILEHYRDHLPLTERTPIISLQEGNTPLIRAEALSRELDIDFDSRWKGPIPPVPLRTGEWWWPSPKRWKREAPR